MDADEPGWPVIDDFFHDESQGRAAATVRRYARVRRHLYDFLDTADMALGLGAEPAALLEAERQFHPSGAFWTLLGTDDLLCCLPSFVHSTWLPTGAVQARTQVSVVSRLLRHLARQPGHERAASSCALYEADDAVAHAKRVIEERAAAEEADRTRMPDRFRRSPGPEW